MTRMVDVRLTVNGKACEGRCEPRTLLADFLRDNLSLTGTHVGCEHGACGACTILFDGEAVRSCIMLAVQADGADIVTIEGMAEAASCIRCRRPSMSITDCNAASARRAC